MKHFNQALSSFDGRVTVSARRLEELDARGKKELTEIEEIDVRAAIGPAARAAGTRSARCRRRSLALALVAGQRRQGA